MVATAGIQAWEGGPRPDGGHSGRGEKQLERLRLCFEVGRLELLMDWVWSMRRVDADTNMFGLRKWQGGATNDRNGGASQEGQIRNASGG